MRTLENLGFTISSKTQNNDNCDNGNIDEDPLSARNETESVGISALEVQSDISALSLYTDCANIDIGILKLNVTPKDKKDATLRGPKSYPTTFPVDKRGSQFSSYLLSFRLKNKEIVPRDWLVWSKSKNVVFLVVYFINFVSKDQFLLQNFVGWQANRGYKNLCDRPDYEKSSNHKSCYIEI